MILVNGGPKAGDLKQDIPDPVPGVIGWVSDTVGVDTLVLKFIPPLVYITPCHR